MTKRAAPNEAVTGWDLATEVVREAVKGASGQSPKTARIWSAVTMAVSVVLAFLEAPAIAYGVPIVAQVAVILARPRSERKNGDRPVMPKKRPER